MAPKKPRNVQPPLRIGQAAEVLGVSVDTIRRWAEDGTLKTTRTGGGQRLVSAAEVRRMLDARRKAAPQRPIAAQSARNRFPGVVTKVEADRVAAIVEVQAGPHRLVSLLTAEAVRELKLAPGVQVIAVVKATNVMIDLPS
ncbi:MAG TPA: helix-turn-helix transcriptional regulator [Candidatus Limnocylindria bacterium]|nr:helix-turn-helix transcriptional regulator [Candidatus Limnocylindria bacterium]